MANKIFLNSRFGYREDTLENWKRENPVLERGEPAIVRDGTDGRWLKIGDGVTPFGALPWKQGPKGPTGSKGEKGDRGEMGPEGAQGIQGPQGVQGPRGAKGDKGDQGVRGLQGVQGIKGEKGDKGDSYVLTEADKNEISAMVTPVVDQTYSPESENAQSGKAVAEAVSGKAVWETIISKSLSEENAGVKTIKIALPEDILKYKMLSLKVQMPYATTLSANAIKQTVSIGDIDSNLYLLPLAYGVGNQATPANSGHFQLFINMSVVESATTYHICSTYPNLLACYDGANSAVNSRQIQAKAQKTQLETLTPYLHLTLTGATYPKSTFVVMEGLK